MKKKVLVLKDVEIPAELVRDMYDNQEGVFGTVFQRTFTRGEIVRVDNDYVPCNEVTEDGSVFFSAPLKKDTVVVTRRNRHLAELFSRKMEELAEIEDCLLDSMTRAEEAVQEIPGAETDQDVIYFNRQSLIGSLETARLQFKADSARNSADRYFRMLAKA